MSEDAMIEIGHRMINECDPREIAHVLLTEVFPELTYGSIYRHFGRKMTILAYRSCEGVSMGEAAKYVDDRFTHNK